MTGRRGIATTLFLVASLVLPAASTAQSVSPSELVADIVAIAGPDPHGPAPSPPIGPAWQIGLERSFDNVGELDLVACDGGFTLLGYVDERRGGRRYRPRALVWTSPDGSEWSRAGALRPSGDPIKDEWAVFDLVAYGGDLLALGAEDRRLAVWRSRDCGETWKRLRDRSVFSGGRKALSLDFVRGVATDDTLLVLGTQAGEMIPYRRWAWTLDERGWRRIRGGLDGVADFGLVSDGQRFLATHEDHIPGARRAGRLITSTDGRRWQELGVLPDDSRAVVPDPVRDRVLAQSSVYGDGWISREIQATTDDETWIPVVRVAPAPEAPDGHLLEADGALVWIFDIWNDVDDHVWSWVALSEDGGSTWTVSAGHPDMRLAGLQSVAATDEAIVLAFTGEGFDAINTWTLARHAVSSGARQGS